MDWTRVIEEERAALGRLVALLGALADLAERAAGRSLVIRGLVLWLLRHAEAVARDFVEGCPVAPSASMSPACAGQLDALRLAISLRALARQLGRQSRRLAFTVRRIGGNPAASPSGRMPALCDALAFLSRLGATALCAPHPAPAPDTS